MKAFVLMRMVNGVPDVDLHTTPYRSHVLCDRISGTDWGAYLVAGTGQQLLALDALPTVVGIVTVTSSGNVHWGELENPCAPVVRTKLNIWLAARGQPTIPDGWTNRQVVQAIFQRANARFDFKQIDITDE